MERNKKSKFKNASELPIYKDTFDLVSSLIDYTNNFQKCYKLTLGNKLIEESLELFGLLQKANYNKSNKEIKVEYLNQFISQFDLVQTLIRFSTEKKQISIKQTANIAQYIECISKQINGWKNV